MNKDNLIYLFHHIHHQFGRHEVHHCDEHHQGIGYTIRHCVCGLHRINKKTAIGDTIDEKLAKKKVRIKFIKKCPEGGWHIESGKLEGSEKRSKIKE